MRELSVHEGGGGRIEEVGGGERTYRHLSLFLPWLGLMRVVALD
jgi:hypothetical protein